MTYYYYLATNYELKEESFGFESMTIQEAVDKGLKMPNFFHIKNLTKQELNEPDGAVFIDDRGSLEIRKIDTEEYYLSELLKKKFVYEVIISGESNYTINLLYEYILSQYKKGQAIEFWQLLNPQYEFVEGEIIGIDTFNKEDIKKLYKTRKDNDRLIIV